MRSLLSLALSFFYFFVSGSESTSDLLLDMKLLYWFMELLFFISESFWLVLRLLVSWGSSWLWLNFVILLFVTLIVAVRVVSNILMCTICSFWRWVFIKSNVLFRSFNFSINNNQVSIHLRLTCLGSTHWSFQSSKSFFTEWSKGYLKLVGTFDLDAFLFLVLPALRELEFSDCIFKSIYITTHLNLNQ